MLVNSINKLQVAQYNNSKSSRAGNYKPNFTAQAFSKGVYSDWWVTFVKTSSGSSRKEADRILPDYLKRFRDSMKEIRGIFTFRSTLDEDVRIRKKDYLDVLESILNGETPKKVADDFLDGSGSYSSQNDFIRRAHLYSSSNNDGYDTWGDALDSIIRG